MIRVMPEDSKNPEQEELLEVVESSPPEMKKRFHAGMRRKKLDRTHEVPDINNSYASGLKRTYD
tara:strand:+ start:555 stop:746 length:192 start_codon:yes stop_codon:yes gene_type:complete